MPGSRESSVTAFSRSREANSCITIVKCGFSDIKVTFFFAINQQALITNIKTLG